MTPPVAFFRLRARLCAVSAQRFCHNIGPSGSKMRWGMIAPFLSINTGTPRAERFWDIDSDKTSTPPDASSANEHQTSVLVGWMTKRTEENKSSQAQTLDLP